MNNRHWRLAFVVPRYMPKGAGGAEVLCQLLAERAVGLGQQVEVLTTCAQDHLSWKNHFPEGESIVNDVKVRRFFVDEDRQTKRFNAIGHRISFRMPVMREEEVQWIENSVVSRRLIQFLEQEHARYDFLIFIPYLFGTTYFGAGLFPEKTLLIPCLHDEPYAYLQIFRELFTQVRGVMFNTPTEMRFAQKLYGLDSDQCAVVGLGFEKGKPVNGELFRRKYGIKDPYILFAGRREKGKNAQLLIEYFRIFKTHHNNNLKLVLLGSGPVDLRPEDQGNIFDLGYVSEEAKLSATAGAFACCQPSVNESLSIVVLQSWLYEVPVLVHGLCAVTRDHCLDSNGGLFFKNYYEFEECLNYFLVNPSVAHQMGRNGRAYVEKHFNWDVVLQRFEAALEKFSTQLVLK